jgi:hypothetical protein
MPHVVGDTESEGTTMTAPLRNTKQAFTPRPTGSVKPAAARPAAGGTPARAATPTLPDPAAYPDYPAELASLGERMTELESVIASIRRDLFDLEGVVLAQRPHFVRIEQTLDRIEKSLHPVPAPGATGGKYDALRRITVDDASAPLA